MLKLLGLSGLAWLTPVGEMIARGAEQSRKRPGKSLILLWLDGGPSQLETFDPHAGSKIAEGTGAIDSNVAGIQLATGLERVSEHMDSLSIVRNVVSKEGDHERANYNVKTGYRPDPTLIHPSLGAILAHQLPAGGTEIPRHISILPAAFPTRGGFLGNRFDAFMTGDPNQPIPDVTKRVTDERFQQRLTNLSVLDDEFSRGRLAHLQRDRTLHQSTITSAVTMMSSEQLAAFDVSQVPKSERATFGETAFGRGCLAAARLVEVGARCVEVNLTGWDVAHVSNHSVHEALTKTLDPALAGLIAYLKQRDQLKDTIIMCCGEFGRTPGLNPAGGRDHWPHGFSIALAGGGIAGGRVLGETDPDGGRVPFDQGTPVENLHATVMHAMGIDFARELDTPVNRPMKLSAGKVISRLLADA
jgi:hypothetical protein